MSIPRTRQRPTAEVERGSYTLKHGGNVSNVYQGAANVWNPQVTHDHLTIGWPYRKSDNPFDSTRWHYSPIRCNGYARQLGGYIEHIWDNSSCTAPSHWGGPPTLRSLPAYAQSCLERIVPYKPVIDVPVEVVEGVRDLISGLSVLRGLASIARKSRRTNETSASDGNYAYRFLNGMRQAYVTPSNVAGSYISYHFTIGTTLRLIQDIFSLQEQIMRRALRLKRLSNRKSIRFSEKEIFETWEWRQNVGARQFTYRDLPHYGRKRDRMWAEGKLQLDQTSLTHIDRLTKSIPYAYKDGLGLRQVGLDSLWEVVPFSWLIDYFIDVQSFLTTLRGFGSYGLTSFCAMNEVYQWKWTEDVNFTWNGSLSFSAGSQVYQSKRRFVRAVLMPGIHLEPLLTPHQQTIIASLAGSRSFGRRWTW